MLLCGVSVDVDVDVDDVDMDVEDDDELGRTKAAAVDELEICCMRKNKIHNDFDWKCLDVVREFILFLSMLMVRGVEMCVNIQM